MRDKAGGKRKPKPKPTAADTRCEIDRLFERIRSHSRAMTLDERIEALLFVHDQALAALSEFSLEGKMKGFDHSATGALWTHVIRAIEAVSKHEERERLKASASSSGTICVVISGVDPAAIVTGDQ